MNFSEYIEADNSINNFYLIRLLGSIFWFYLLWGKAFYGLFAFTVFNSITLNWLSIILFHIIAI